MVTLLTVAAATLSYVTADVTDNVRYHHNDVIDNGDIRRCSASLLNTTNRRQLAHNPYNPAVNGLKGVFHCA